MDLLIKTINHTRAIKNPVLQARGFEGIQLTERLHGKMECSVNGTGIISSQY